MKSARLVALSLAFTTASVLMGDTEAVGGYTWTYSVGGDGTVAIHGQRQDAPSISPNPEGTVVIPSTLGGRPVKSIEYCAFSGCTNMTSVIIPESVLSIETYAFYNCSGLTNVTIPNGVASIGYGAFEHCEGLTNVTIPNSVTSIWQYAFCDCSSLMSITIPDSVKSIGDLVFYGCTNLMNITIPSGVTRIGANLFGCCSGLMSVMLPDSVTSIGDNAFRGCSSLTSIGMPEGLMSIGKGAFVDCIGLTSVTIPNGVDKIESYAFSGCSGLTEVNMPNSVTNIGEWAFAGCNRLPNVTIPGLVTSIEDSAFRDCSLLVGVTIPNSVTKLGNWVFAGCNRLTDANIPDSVTSIGDSAFRDCSSLVNMTIPDSVSKIGAYAFYNCSSLMCMTIPGSVTNIEEMIFGRCVGLTSVTISGSVTTIGDGAFWVCRGLTNVTIPDSVTSVGASAFRYCSGLTNLTMTSDCPTVGESAFDGIDSSCVVRLPRGNDTYLVTDGKWQGMTVEYYGAASEPVWTIINGVLTAVSLNGNKEVIIPDGVRSIGDRAFYDCSDIAGVTIPGSVTNIGQSAFSSCSGLTNVLIEEGVTRIEQSAFSGCGNLTSVTLPDSLNRIGSYAFQNCSALASVTIPDSVTDIGYYAFGWCSALERVTIPGSVKIIANQAFKYCSGLTEVTIGDGVTRIGQDAFYGCSSLVGVTIPDSVTSIYMDAFTSCNEGLCDTTTIPGVKLVDGWAVGKTVSPVGNLNLAGARGIASGAFRNCSGLTSVTIPDGVKAIDDSAFDDCSALTFVTISDSVKRMGYGVFTGCNEALFDTTTIPGVKLVDGWAVGHTDSLAGTVDLTGVRGIGCSAFFGCGDMTGVVIPSSVKGIGQDAFTRCDSLTTIYVDSGDVERVKKLFEESWKDTSAFTFMELVATPVITPGDGSTFDDDKCTVAIACGTEGASIYYSTNGVTPRASAQYLYSGPFEIDGTVQIVAFAMKNGSASEYAEAAITKVVTPLTLALALDEEKLGEIATGGDAEWTPQRDAGAKAGKSVARSGAVGMNQETWLETTVRGKGTLTFWWKTSCEADPRGRHTYDHLTFSTAEGELYWLDGDSGWQQRSVTFDTDGDHTVRWTYSTDDWDEPGYQNCGWVDGVAWTGAASSGTMPSVVGDPNAIVTGDDAAGFVVRPSSGVDDVEVLIPDGVTASMVVVEVPTTAKSVTANGAIVKIVKVVGEERYDITKYLAMPEPVGGRIDVSQIKVLQKYADAVFDFAEGARFDLNAANPITTARTEPGLTYILMEGRTLDAIEEGDSKVGDGNAWSPRISVKGGPSGFYRIRVVK